MTPTLDIVSVDRRVGPYAVLVAGGVVVALVTGIGAFLAVAAPAALALARALAAGRAPRVCVTVGETPARVLEGDTWPLSIDLGWTGPAEVDVLVTGLRGHAPIGPPGAVVVSRDGSTVRLDVRAERWGRHELGEVVLRVRRPGGAFVRDLVVPVGRTVRVLPPSSRLDAVFHPARPRAAAGPHPAPSRGPGTDFADLRPYVPGDRLRDLSWSASARSDAPWVIDHHPERTGTVVLVLDAFTETGVPAGALDRAARVAWSIARHHLLCGDRVGLLAAGPIPRWLPPVAGRRARWQLLDALLAVQDRSSRHVGAPPTIPADAFVVAVSPLQSDAFVADVVHHRRVGRPTAVVAVETIDLLAPTSDEVERAARRLWRIDAEVRRANLSRAGVRTVGVGDDVTMAVRALSRLPHRSVVVV